MSKAHTIITVDEWFWPRVRKLEYATRPDLGPCWIWIGQRRNSDGYGGVKVPGTARNVSVHRISWELENGPVPNGLLVLHKCDNRPCVRPSHLFLGTQTDNMRDMVIKGRSSSIKGESNPKARLTQAEVEHIRKEASIGKRGTPIVLAKVFGVSIGCIHDIVKRRSWRHI